MFLSHTNGTLQNIAAKDLAPPEIEQSLVQARSLGQTQLERFVERRLLSADREEEEAEEGREEGAEENFLDPIPKLSLKVWTWAGTSKKPKHIPLEEVSGLLVTRQVYCYNFTPSPAVTAPRSLICGHSKKTAWKVFTEHFDLLSSVARVVLFGKLSGPEKLPPTRNAFKQHLKRCHYQTAVWRQARIQKPVLPYPEETDWTLAEDLLVLSL